MDASTPPIDVTLQDAALPKDAMVEPVLCTDPHEPNDWVVTASPAPFAQDVTATLCPSDVDLFAVPGGAGGLLRIELRGAPLLRAGVYDVQDRRAGILEQKAEVHATPEGSSVTMDADPTRSLVVRIDGHPEAGGEEYLLRLDLEPAECTDDAYEPNDAPEQATLIAEPTSLWARVCAADVDWWRLDVPPETHLRVAATPEAPGALLALSGVLDGEDIAAVALVDGAPAVVALAAPEARSLLVRVAPKSAYETVPYALEVEAWPALGAAVVAVTGVVRYEDRKATLNGYEPGPWLPAAHTRVRVARELDGATLGETCADAEGRYALEITNDGPAVVVVSALTELCLAVAPVALRTGLGAKGVALTATSGVVTAPSGVIAVDLVAPADGQGGAFNALDVARRAMEAIADWLGAPPAPLLLVYEPGAAGPCGSCYMPPDGALAIAGSPMDDDAYDDAVVAHEVAHHFEYAHGRSDSPGGPHDGRYTDPRLAWSEGFANAFAAAVLGDAVLVDVELIEETLVLDVENVDTAWSYGTSDGTMAGALSEDLVAAVVWDLLDSTNTGLDTASAPLGALLEVAACHLPAGSDRGFVGIDLVDFLDAWLCFGAASPEAVRLIAVEERKLPYTLAPSPVCPSVCD